MSYFRFTANYYLKMQWLILELNPSRNEECPNIFFFQMRNSSRKGCKSKHEKKRHRQSVKSRRLLNKTFETRVNRVFDETKPALQEGRKEGGTEGRKEGASEP